MKKEVQRSESKKMAAQGGCNGYATFISEMPGTQYFIDSSKLSAFPCQNLMLACVYCIFIHNRNLLVDVDYRLNFRPLSLEKHSFILP